MSNKKRVTYRHPVTNKFISKKEWEELNTINVVQKLPGSDFDVDKKYYDDTKDFIKKIEEDFNNLTKEVVETSPIPEEDKKDGWKLFFKKLRFWI